MGIQPTDRTVIAGSVESKGLLRSVFKCFIGKNEHSVSVLPRAVGFLAWVVGQAVYTTVTVQGKERKIYLYAPDVRKVLESENRVEATEKKLASHLPSYFPSSFKRLSQAQQMW